MDLLLKKKLEKLVDGKASFTSSNLGFNLLISRLQKKYAGNHTPVELSNCIQEMDAFLLKYNSIMASEIQTIKEI